MSHALNLSIRSSFDSDWPRKVVILLLALATVMEVGSAYQKYCALAGIGLVMVLLLANLGSKACVAPHEVKASQIQGGGKSAIELITFNCIVSHRRFPILQPRRRHHQHGNMDRNVRHHVHICCRQNHPSTPHPEDANSTLVEDQTSPVGYKVPNFPNFHIDPIMFGNKDLQCSLHLEMLAGLFVAVEWGFVVSTTLFDFMNDANEYLNEI
ncbi:hypothetical protein ACHAW5_009045 [Stephanodiscus triporus]|uniref:Uncharacterized protein n=1 Tax=Stephanodiscus triporus TaxID=2934178 RepID=A0ABD3MRG3_9STRA